MPRLTRSDEISAYLTDASQFRGAAEGVFLPAGEKEIVEFLKEANAGKIPVTVSGGRTGLTGAAVPESGWVLSTEKLSRILEVKKDPSGKNSRVRAEPGIFLKELRQALESQSLFYPPDPTGPKAFLGGTLATNASGPNSFKYGATRRYVRRLRIVLASGEILDLGRGQIRANREGVLEIPLEKRKLKIPVPHYSLPRVKHAGGYFAEPGMDAVDLFIGAEGTLGVITEIELSLLPKPAEVLAFIAFFPTEEKAWNFVKKIRSVAPLQPRILEYFDHGSLEFMRPRFSTIPKGAKACLFIEEEASLANKEKLSEEWRRLFEKEGALEEVWEAESSKKREEFRDFRSALPLAIRDFLAQHAQVKIGTDTCVPHEKFEALMLFHRHSVEKLKIPNLTFGHIGESHVHLNLLPRNSEEHQKARALYPELVQKAVELGGTFSAEHGVGKLKRTYLAQFFGKKGIEEMAAVKRIFDPHLILGQGNLFEIQ